MNEQRRIGPYKTRHPGGASHHGKDWFLTNTTEVDLSDSAKLRNIFGWSDSKTRSEQPQLGAPFVTILTANAAAGEFGNQLKVRSVSEELQLVGDAMDGKLDYIFGYYFQKQRSDTLWPQTYFDVSPIIPPSYVTNNFRIRNRTNAVYGQVSYAVLPDLKLTGGLRYTWERVSIAQLPGATYTYGARPEEDLLRSVMGSGAGVQGFAGVVRLSQDARQLPFGRLQRCGPAGQRDGYRWRQPVQFRTHAGYRRRPEVRR
ncbi:hypothetical protein ADT71_22985 [Novosphingobium sp. ST904]|nr:hypothetical protein ADT71_22985 [Novosphingobium sp. ST904]